jgi:hypothetical protein
MNMKRMRGRNHRQGGGGGGGGGGFRNQQNGIPLNRNHVFDSSGPEMRVRGTAQQLFDKYTQLARDAASSGDRVLGEAYYQHAEHYFRIISAINQAQGVPNQPQNGQQPYAAGAEGEGEAPRQEFRQEIRPENRPESRPENRQDNRQENREPRQDNQNRQEYRHDRNDNRQDNRENRQDNRDNRRFDQRPRQEFQPRDRNEQRPYRQSQPPIAEAPIDISSALEAELAAAVAEPPGMTEQPAIQHELVMHTPEPRAIPISPAAPPAAEEEAPAPVRRRGRPKAVKAETETPSE